MTRTHHHDDGQQQRDSQHHGGPHDPSARPKIQPQDRPRDEPGAGATPPRTPTPRSAFSDELPVEPLDPVLLAEVLDALATRQDHLDRLLGALTEQITATAAGGPWAWRHLTPEQSRDLFGQLQDFVDWVITRYDLRGEAHTIAPCWYRHPVAVEELTALMVAWHGAYPANVAKASDNPAGWHERWLWPTLRRLNLELRTWAKCTGGTHHPARPGPATTDAGAFAAFLDHDVDPDRDRATIRHEGGMDAARVHTLLATGAAAALLPDDPCTPIRYQGRWYGIPDLTTKSEGADAAAVRRPVRQWQPLDSERAAQFDLLHARQTQATSAASEPA